MGTLAGNKIQYELGFKPSFMGENYEQWNIKRKVRWIMNRKLGLFRAAQGLSSHKNSLGFDFCKVFYRAYQMKWKLVLYRGL